MKNAILREGALTIVRRAGLVGIVLIVASTAIELYAQHGGHGGGENSHGAADKPSVHGMVLFGEPTRNDSSGGLYASHLPLFRTPHDYQVLLKITLDAAAFDAYKKSRRAFPREPLYTIEPELFVLPEMIAAPRPFKAKLYRGHFERGGKAIAESTVSIARVLYSKKFDSTAEHGGTAYYIAFGTKSKLYAAHLITGKPDFDHIVEISATPRIMPQTVSPLLFLDASQTKVNSRGARVGAQCAALNGRTKCTVSIRKSLYLEYGDLK